MCRCGRVSDSLPTPVRQYVPLSPSLGRLTVHANQQYRMLKASPLSASGELWPVLSPVATKPGAPSVLDREFDATVSRIDEVVRARGFTPLSQTGLHFGSAHPSSSAPTGPWIRTKLRDGDDESIFDPTVSVALLCFPDSCLSYQCCLPAARYAHMISALSCVCACCEYDCGGCVYVCMCVRVSVCVCL